MVRFIAGIAVCLIVQAVGLDIVMAGLRKADAAARAAWHASQAQLAEKAGAK